MQKEIEKETIEKIAYNMIAKHKNITIRELQEIAILHEEDPDWYIFTSEDYWLYIYNCAINK